MQLLPFPFHPAQGSYPAKLYSGQVTGLGRTQNGGFGPNHKLALHHSIHLLSSNLVWIFFFLPISYADYKSDD